MSPLSKLHKHPDFDANSGPSGKRTHIYGHLLEEGDELEATDYYSSSNESWEPCPAPGTILGKGTAVVWVRPA